MDLELRLHLAAEDIDVALEMDSARALQRIPAAVQEILHLRVSFYRPAEIYQQRTQLVTLHGLLQSSVHERDMLHRPMQWGSKETSKGAWVASQLLPVLPASMWQPWLSLTLQRAAWKQLALRFRCVSLSN